MNFMAPSNHSDLCFIRSSLLVVAAAAAEEVAIARVSSSSSIIKIQMALGAEGKKHSTMKKDDELQRHSD